MTRPIGLVVAMEAELVHLLALLDDVETRLDGIWTNRFARLNGQEIVIARSGMGVITAAAATERLIDRFAPELVLNYGCAGAHRREIMPGDVIIGEWVVNQTEIQILPDGSERYVGFGWEVAGEKADAAALASDPRLLEIATDVAKTYQAEPWPKDLLWPESVPHRPSEIHSGTVLSADIWTQSHARLDILHARHASLCEDMEAAAVGQICAMHGVPFLTVKDISNNEFHRASNLQEFDDFPRAEVGKRAAGLIYRVLERLTTE
jgi:adenosylhomocysteine nucleosidase